MNKNENGDFFLIWIKKQEEINFFNSLGYKNINSISN